MWVQEIESLDVAKVEVQAGAYIAQLKRQAHAHVTWSTCKAECRRPRQSSEA